MVKHKAKHHHHKPYNYHPHPWVRFAPLVYIAKTKNITRVACPQCTFAILNIAMLHALALTPHTYGRKNQSFGQWGATLHLKKGQK